MKTFQKRLCTVLPRVRSNSVSSPRLYSNSPSLSLFDSSTPPPSRPTLSSGRLSIEAKPAEVEGSQNSQHNSHSHPPFSLALTQPQSSSGPTLANTNPQGQYALFPYSSLTHPSYAHAQSSQQPAQDHPAHPRPKRQRLKYQLDVGAYGIPKRCRALPSPSRRHHTRAGQNSSSEDLSLAVQIGEDAYFIRDNAMGVADGVGGWTKSHSRPSSTPSALFARRLMHYCSAEVDTASTPHSDPSSTPSTATTSTATALPSTASPYSAGPCPLPPSRPQFSFTHHLKPRHPSPTSPAWKWSDSSMSSSLPASWTLHEAFNSTTPIPTAQSSVSAALENDQEDLEQDLEDSLEELYEGIDVLQILERAYDKTLKAHVVPNLEQPSSAASASSSPSSPTRTEPITPTTSKPESKPLLAGSSTALLAILDHPPRPSHTSSSNATTATTAHSSKPSTPGSPVHVTTKLNTADETPFAATTATATTSTSSTSTTPAVECELEECMNSDEYDAVIKIAHVGDCMGMLVRGEDIVWRSEEMWWDFNTPVQLGPSTSTCVTPRNSATVITLPVKADDILILASDGLSDNLWDEDVLDEVVRFKKTFLSSTSSTSTTIVPEKEKESESEVDDSGYSSVDDDIVPPQASASTVGGTEGTLKRKTLAGMLSEALCSRARRVSERRSSGSPSSPSDEVPFARRAREVGKRFSGGKNDDISVVVAVISPKRK